MEPDVQNFLYRNPQFYELVYPEPDERTPQMCRRMFARYLATKPSSILDLGCGTGRDLDVLSRDGADCWGIDFLAEVIEFARSLRPHLHLEVGDLRSLRLARTFDVVMCMGSALMYALSNDDVQKAFNTFAAHSHDGTLLILDINNAGSYLGGGTFKTSTTTEFRTPEFSATATSTYHFDRRRQLMVRNRDWKIDGQEPAHDYCRYRLFFPQELEHLLAENGFEVLGMFDNMELNETDLSGPRLYLASQKKSR